MTQKWLFQLKSLIRIKGKSGEGILVTAWCELCDVNLPKSTKNQSNENNIFSWHTACGDFLRYRSNLLYMSPLPTKAENIRIILQSALISNDILLQTFQFVWLSQLNMAHVIVFRLNWSAVSGKDDGRWTLQLCRSVTGESSSTAVGLNTEIWPPSLLLPGFIYMATEGAQIHSHRMSRKSRKAQDVVHTFTVLSG